MKYIIASIALLFSVAVFATDYDVTATWVDPTPTGPEYTPQYDLQYRVNGGADTTVEDLASPTWAGIVVANATDNIEVRVRAENAQGPISGPWTAYTSAGAPVCAVVPSGQTSLTVNVQCP